MKKNMYRSVLALIMLITCAGIEGSAPARVMVKLQSKDGREFLVERSKIEASVTIRNMLEDVIDVDLNLPILLPNIDGNTLEVVIDCVNEPENALGIIISLTGDRIQDRIISFITAINYLYIPDIFRKLPMVKWLCGSIRYSRIRQSHVYTVKILDGIATICRAGDNMPIHALTAYRNMVTSVAISSGGVYVVTGLIDGTVKIWDSFNGKCIDTLRGHVSRVSSVAISPDGEYIVTGSVDGTIKVWWYVSSNCMYTLDRYTDTATSITISSNDQSIFIKSGDGRVKEWCFINGQVFTSRMFDRLNQDNIYVWDDKDILNEDAFEKLSALNLDQLLLLERIYQAKINQIRLIIRTQSADAAVLNSLPTNIRAVVEQHVDIQAAQ